jgi:acyl dehydratase
MTKTEVPAEKLKDYLTERMGQELAISDWFEIDQERVNQFAACTEDPQWIHVDVERAKNGPFGGTIIHGNLLLSLVPSFFTDNITFTPTGLSLYSHYGFEKVRFISPVKVGSRIRIKSVLSDLTEKRSGLLLKVTSTIEVQGSEKPACVAEFLSLWVR